MMDIELLEQVIYPGEKEEYMIWDGIEYNDVIKGLKFTLSYAKGQLKKDTQDTLTELERRWKERQENQAVNKNSKKNRDVIHTNTVKTFPPI